VRRKLKTKITLELDTDLLRKILVVAADEGRSVSAIVSEHLKAIICDRKAFYTARKRALKRLRKGMDLGWNPPRSRDELH
jgi:hypothetical protein